MSAIMLEPPSPFLGPEPPREPSGKTAPTEDQQDDRPREPDRPPRNDRHLARGFRMADCIVRPDRGSIARPGEDAEFVEPKLMEVLLHLAVADGEVAVSRVGEQVAEPLGRYPLKLPEGAAPAASSSPPGACRLFSRIARSTSAASTPRAAISAGSSQIRIA